MSSRPLSSFPPRSFVYLGLLAAAGCGFAQSSLSELGDVTLLASKVVSGPPTWEGSSPLWTAITLHSDSCAELRPDAQATFNGVAMKRVESGGYRLGQAPSCHTPQFLLSHAVPAPADADGFSTFRVFDSTRTLTMRVRNLGSSYPLHLAEPEGQALTALTVGSRAVVHWLDQSATLQSERFSVWLERSSPRMGMPVDAPELGADGRTISFTVPEFSPGEADLFVLADAYLVSDCEGPTQCIVQAAHGRLGTSVQR
jgi:hypothetical protein